MPTQPNKKKSGLAFWMHRALDECGRASLSFAPDPVHDLRVALRRCCSMADGIAVLDPDPAWRDMKKAGKRLFRRLGELRDVHVMQEWVHLLDTPDDPVTGPLLQSVAAREPQLQQEAMQALSQFDRKQWQRWGRSLPRRMARFRPGSLVFRHLALERWTEAHKLHRQAMRHASPAAFHRLRIGIKRFRYIVENFLPEQHAAWSDDLKHMQDLLGEIHDLDVLRPAAVAANIFPDSAARSRWQNRIHQERVQRIEAYRQKAMPQNKDSLWQVWRGQLPDRQQTQSAALLRLKLWASSLDPDFQHSGHVARLTLQLYDGLTFIGKGSGSAVKERAILQAAALLHDVGRSKNEKGHHKASYQMIRRLSPPLGWRAQDLLARCNRCPLSPRCVAPCRTKTAPWLVPRAKARHITFGSRASPGQRLRYPPRPPHSAPASRERKRRKQKQNSADRSPGLFLPRQPGRSHRRCSPPTGNRLSPPRDDQAHEGSQKTRGRKPASSEKRQARS